MKTLWLLRHGYNVLHPDWRQFGMWQAQSPLSEKGRGDIARVRTTYLQGERFKALFHSPFRRAMETAQIAVPDGKWVALPTLAPRLPQVLDTLVASVEGGLPETSFLEEMEARWPGLLQVETEWVLQGIQTALNALQDDEQALLVGHQPVLGLVRGTFDRRFPLYEQTLPKGGMYRCRFTDPTHAQVEYLPPPSENE